MYHYYRHLWLVSQPWNSMLPFMYAIILSFNWSKIFLNKLTNVWCHVIFKILTCKTNQVENVWMALKIQSSSKLEEKNVSFYTFCTELLLKNTVNYILYHQTCFDLSYLCIEVIYKKQILCLVNLMESR